jgi:hypothetical protein
MRNEQEQALAEGAYAELLGRVGAQNPELQKMLSQKWAEDRQAFMEAVKEETAGRSQESWATKNCKKCYGRGFVGVLLASHNRNDKDQNVSCPCTSKNYGKWMKKFREEFNEKRDKTNAESTDSAPQAQADRPEAPQEEVADSQASG